jgi:hypothetical protein
MNATDFIVEKVLTNARALLRRHAPMTGDVIDLCLAGLENDLRADLDDLDAQHERAIRLEVRWAREEWEAKQRKTAKAKKKREAVSL